MEQIILKGEMRKFFFQLLPKWDAGTYERYLIKI